MKKTRDLASIISRIGITFGLSIMLALSLYNYYLTAKIVYSQPISDASNNHFDQSITAHFDFITTLEEIEERQITFTDIHGREWSVPIDVDLKTYNDCRSNGYVKVRDNTVVNFDNKKYMEDTRDNDEIYAIASYIKETAKGMGYNDFETVYVFIRMVQSIEYMDDEEYCNGSANEFPKLPIVTLYDGSGDCEDTTYALTALLRAAGYDAVIVNYPGHAMCAIAGEFNSGSYFTLSGSDTQYYYIETTEYGWNIGELPEQFYSQEPSVFKYVTK